ncbi:DUF6436 domain-containing protein [Rheinheimera texasensis]|uniref:DUF6436 domain-containing protein n=1 Tax=Rheinheimera texasensis TaxID=306205 RepID=UPI0012FF0D38|nr:DUF6436 domain-containing protein [Rheinheimera texasensis]
MKKPSVLLLNIKRQWLLGLGLACWALISLSVLAVFEQQRYGVFDPTGRLQQLQPRAAMPAGNLLVAVIDPHCSCARAARAHLQQLKQQNPGLVLQELTPAQWRQYGTALPATPAVLWYQQQQLRYAGPLAQGPLCASSSDLLLPLLQGKQQLAGVWLNSETVACRCLS